MIRSIRAVMLGMLPVTRGVAVGGQHLHRVVRLREGALHAGGQRPPRLVLRARRRG
jgi:hypothetical protein